MALRDYYRCKKCDAKVVYGPDRSEEDWDPFLLCRACLTALEQALTYSQQRNAEFLEQVGAMTLAMDRLKVELKEKESLHKIDAEHLQCLQEDNFAVMQELREYLEPDDEIIHGVKKLKRALESRQKPVTDEIVKHPATETTRPWEETLCAHCREPIWRTTDGHGGNKWNHRNHPHLHCQYPQTLAEPARSPSTQK